SQLKRGIDCTAPDGTVYRSSELTSPAPASRSYAYCSDTRAFAQYVDHIREADLLYHESTFMQDMLPRAIETYPSTAYEAAHVALQVGAKAMLLGPYSARHRDLQPRVNEATAIFPSAHLSPEGY